MKWGGYNRRGEKRLKALVCAPIYAIGCVLILLARYCVFRYQIRILECPSLEDVSEKVR